MDETYTPPQKDAETTEDPFAAIQEMQRPKEFDMSAAAQRSQALFETQPDDDKPTGFLGKAQEFRENHPATANALTLGVAAGALALGGVGVYNGLTQPNASQQAGMDRMNEIAAQSELFATNIEAAVNASYDRSAVVGEIPISQGDSLYGPTINIVIDRIGQDAYNDNQSRLVNAIDASTKKHNPQPGETYAVVETDVDPEKNNGNEFVTVDISHVIDTLEPGEKLPSPVIEGQQLPTINANTTSGESSDTISMSLSPEKSEIRMVSIPIDQPTNGTAGPEYKSVPFNSPEARDYAEDKSNY